MKPQNLTLVGDILRYEYIYISVMTNDKKELFIEAWVDEDQFLGESIYLLFQITKEFLEGYINRQITYYSMIKNAAGGNYWLNEKPKVWEDLILTNYLPNETALFEEEYDIDGEITAIRNLLN